MKTVGLFEAKAKLSEICERVARSGQSMVITRRGRPLVRIDPLPRGGSSVWEDRASYIATRGRLTEEFELPLRSRELPRSTLEE
jgi:prevent-host-death family protein